MNTSDRAPGVKCSKYNIIVEMDGKYAIFNTLSSSVVKIDEDMYQSFFLNQDFKDSAYIQFIPALKEMGMLVDDCTDENFMLQTIRRRYQYDAAGVRSAVIAVTTECNARCYYCYENGIARKPMTMETAEAIVKFLAENCVDHKIVIQWFGGEPLCAVEVIDYITNGLQKRGVFVSSLITTNGYNVTEDILKKAKESWNIKRFQIPVDALGEQYNKIKNYKDTDMDENPFEIIIKNIHAILDAGFHVNVRTNFQPEEIESTREVLQYLAKEFEGEKRFFAYPAPITGKEVPSIVGYQTEEGKTHPYLDLLLESRKLGFFCPTLLKEESYMNGDEALSGISLASRPTGCYATLLSSYAIDSEGDLYKCHRLLGRGKEYACGDVFEGIRYTNALKWFCDDEMCYTECEECALMPLCHGGCKVKKEWYGDKNGCMAIKDIVKDIVKIYVNEISKKQ